MTSLDIDESSIPELEGQVAIVTGGSTGIGHAAVNLLTQKGATVHVLDIKEPQPYDHAERVVFHRCDVTVWQELSETFLSVPRIDMAFVNAGVGETSSFFNDLQPMTTNEDKGSAKYAEPDSPVLAVNLKASLNCIRLAIHRMKNQKPKGGRIVITASSTAYMPERSIPLYSAIKLALVGLVRSLRHTLPKLNITINAVAPAATITPLIEGLFLDTVRAENLPCTLPQNVALALVFSATATETENVETYGSKSEVAGGHKTSERRWNGRVILTIGKTYTEVEKSLVNLRPQWFGEENEKLSMMQQAAFAKFDELN